MSMRFTVVLSLSLVLSSTLLFGEQITSTPVSTDSFILDGSSNTSLTFVGTNEFDFSGDDVADQRLRFTLVVESADSSILSPVLDEFGEQTGNLELESNFSSLLITYTIDGITQLPGADPGFTYRFESADFLGANFSNSVSGIVIFSDDFLRSEESNPTYVHIPRNGHWAAEEMAIGQSYQFKVVPDTGSHVLESLTHSTFTVDVTPIPEPGFMGLLAIGLLSLTSRKRRLEA